MKINKLTCFVILAGALGVAAAFLQEGCATKQVTTVSNGVTNTVTVVDEVGLAIDSQVVQGLTAATVAIVKQKDPSVVPALTDAHIALDGVLNGSNTNTLGDVVTMLKAQNNPALTAAVTQLVKQISAVEQGLLKKYGATVGGEISTAIAISVDAGLVIGLGL